MKLIIYRSKETGVIVDYHEMTNYCTEDKLRAFNKNEKNTLKVELVELEENSIAYYFYSLKTRQIKDEAEDLRDLADDLQAIANRIDDRLYDFDKWFKEERGGE